MTPALDRLGGVGLDMLRRGFAWWTAELAAVANYVISHFGGKTGRVTPEDVAKRRRE